MLRSPLARSARTSPRPDGWASARPAPGTVRCAQPPHGTPWLRLDPGGPRLNPSDDKGPEQAA